MNKENIILGYSQKDHRFTIYDHNKLLGGFGIINIIKYITSQISREFLSSVEYESFLETIEKFFCKLDYSPLNNISIISHLDSPLTGNIEIMIKIYFDINKFNQEILPNEITKISDKKTKNRILSIIENLVNISNAIKDNDTKKELKQSLIKYSIFITNKINHIIANKLNTNQNDIFIINEELQQLQSFKKDNNQKIKKIDETINNQNEKIKKIIDYIDIDNIEDIMNEYNQIDIINSDNNSQYEENIDKSENKNNIDEIFFKDEDNGYLSDDSESNKNYSNIEYLTPKND